MDPLGVTSPRPVKIEELLCWQSIPVTDSSTCDEANETNCCPFSFNEEINQKVYLWNGDISKLSVQALVLPVYEILSKSSELGHQVQKTAGQRLHRDVRSLTELRTSEVRIHNGYDLPARYIVHTVEPKYNPRYTSAADNSLHICYRASLQATSEKNIETVAISPIHITRKGFPVMEGTHIALRTIRKCLEMLLPKFKAVIVVTDSATVEAYSALFPAYFPRSISESKREAKNLPPDIQFNEWGALIQPEREIRIADFTNQQKQELQNHDDDVENCMSENVMIAIDQSMTQHSFASMSGDHDRKRKIMLQNMSRERIRVTQERIYQRLLRIARDEDFSRLSALKAIQISGRDVFGNRVVVFIGRQIPVPELDFEKVLFYLILTLDAVVNEPYTIVYFHTCTTAYNQFSSEFHKKLYNTFDQRYRSNLTRFCMVHLSTWTKVMTWIFTSFHASEIKNRIVNVHNIPQLYKIVPPDQIDVPPFVLSYDMERNPEAYKVSPQHSPNQYKTRAVFNHEVPGAL